MPAEDFFSALHSIKNPAKNFMVVLTGGEPLLRKDLETCGREIRKRMMRWSLVSNGHLLDRERLNSLLNAGLGALTISLDGLEHTHNWLRNSDSSFIKVVKAIELAAGSSRLNFDIVTCVHQRNLMELGQIRELLISLRVPKWRLFTINPELFLSDHQFVELMEFISCYRKNKAIEINFSCEGYVGRYETKVRNNYFFCRAGINIGSILIDGSISACPNIDRSFSQGNIYRDDLSEVWQTRFEPFRNRDWTRIGPCATCKEYKYCQGNGFHNWHGEKKKVLVCYKEKIEHAASYPHIEPDKTPAYNGSDSEHSI
jgi:radical SAM protein with 4Fe4S-binding SPASM domain